MSHGIPDWGVTAGVTKVYQLTDLAEAVVRLGSPVSYDRRGDVVFIDEFENGLNKWSTVPAGDDASVGLSILSARSGDFSAKLVGGKTTPWSAEIVRGYNIIDPSRLGIEFSFALSGLISHIELTLEIYDGTTIHTAQLRWDDGNNNFDYSKSGGGWGKIADTKQLAASLYIYHTMKMVIDLNTEEYVRALLDNDTYPLTDIAYDAVVSSAAPRISVTISLFSRNGQNDDAYIDDVIFTQNEP